VVYKLTHPGAAYGQAGLILLTAHSYISLYGWNLSGMLAIARKGDFPLKADIRKVIFLHWVVIFTAIPGRFLIGFSVISLAAFVMLLVYFLKVDGGKMKYINKIMFDRIDLD
jgi:hypothetical protein